MKTLRRLFLMLMIGMVAVPLAIMAQDDGSGSITLPNGSTVSYPPQPYYGELIDYPGTSSGDQSGKLLVAPDDDELTIPMPNNSKPPADAEEELEIPPVPPINNKPPAEEEEELEIPVPPTRQPPTAQPPAQPIKLVRGFYKQVGEPKITTTGTCFDKSVDAKGSCAADAQGTNEVHDFHNCWSNDPNSPNNKPYDGLEPVCQSTDSESLYMGEPSQFYGRLTGSAYGHGSAERQMLEEGGVSIASYGIVVGTQIEVLSPTKFVVKYVHREQGGCTRTVRVYYELSGQSEAACQQVIEVPEEQQQAPISTPPPLPPIEDHVTYTVALPVLPAECTAETRPPEDFKDAHLKLDQQAGTLSINYGAGSYTAFQNFGSTFSYVDLRTTIFRLNFTVFSDKISFHWYKTDASGTACNLDGELRPGTSKAVQSNTEAAAVKNSPYKAEWKPIEAFCTPETIAALPNFTQVTIKGSQDTFTIDYGTGSYPLTRQMGSDTYYYMVTDADGSTIMVSLNSHTPDKFALLYQYSDAAGNMCMANLDLTN